MSDINESGKFRKKRNRFSQVSNHCLDNDKLSLRAKGLYALIQSKIDIPGYVLYKTILQDKFCKEGRDAFNAAWKELINAGYLKIYKINTKKGFIYEYELLDEPESEEISKENSKKSSALKTKINSLKTPDTENPYVGYPDVENPTTNNININNINTNNNIYNDVDNRNKINFKKNLSNQLIELKNNIKKDNENYNCINDKNFENLLNEPSVQNALLEFDNYHNNLKDKDLYRFEDIALFWVRIYDVYNSNEFIINAENKVIEIIKSFKNQKDQISIRNLSKDDLIDIFEISLKYYDPFEITKISDINGYLATVIKSKF